ncbi:MAG: hypothetical protein JXA93_25045 [Anaerolineae bacterium]|nr:hypothetical protein [Anaerolineae bacterium]
MSSLVGRVGRARLLGAGIILTVTSALVAWYLVPAWGRSGPGFPYDDAWIHAVFARNLVQHHTIGFYPAQWTGGTSSFLWVLALAIGLAAGLDPPAAAALLGTAASVVTGIVFFFLLASELENHAAALFWALLAVALGPTIYLALSGMETLFFVALALLSVALFVKANYPGAGLLLALLVLTRIEALALAGVLGLAALIRHRRQALQPILWTSVPPLVTLFVFAVYNLAVTDTLLPTTMAGRKWLWGLPDATVTLTPTALVSYLDTWRLYVEGWLFHAHTLPDPLRFLYRLLIWSSLATGAWLLIRATVRSARERQVTAAPLLFWWALAHNGIYLFLSPMPSIRHQVPNLLLVILLLAVVWQAATTRLRTRGVTLRALPLAFLLLVAIGLIPTSWEWRQAYSDHVAHINRVHAAAGRWIDANLPVDARLAAFDIGALAYFGNREVLDLGGLVEHDFARRYLYPRRVDQYLIEREVDYLALPEEDAILSGLAQRLGLDRGAQLGFTLEPVASFAVEVQTPPPFDVLPYYYYIPALWHMRIYHLAVSQ